MAIVLKRLQRILEKDMRDSSPEICEELPPKSYSAYLETKPERKNIFFKLLVEEDASLVLEYKTLRALLEKTLSQTGFDESKATLLIQEALDLAILIEQKYQHHIHERPNLRKADLRVHQIKYREWLQYSSGHVAPTDTASSNTESSFVADIRSLTEQAQPYRLSFLRARRVLTSLVPLINDFEHYDSWILWADAFIAPLVAYLGLVFFMPRLFVGLCTLLTPVPQGSTLSPQDHKLWFSTHVSAQWSRLWPNITNDIAWATFGVLTCFVFIGSLQPMAVYATLVMQLYDAILAGLRTYWELSRLNNLRKEYQAIRILDPGEQQIDDYLSCLEAGIKREKALLYLLNINFLTLLLVAILSLPLAMAFSPALPAIAAMMSLIITAINFGGQNYLTKQEPHWLVNSIMKAMHSRGWLLFAQSPSDGLDKWLKRDDATCPTCLLPSPDSLDPIKDPNECFITSVSGLHRRHKSGSALSISTAGLMSSGFLSSLGKSRSLSSLTVGSETVTTSISEDILLRGSPRAKPERGISIESDGFYIGEDITNNAKLTSNH